MSGYTDELKGLNLPDDAFLGSLLYFSISNADVDLEAARNELANAGLSTETLRKNLRPIDAFSKSSREMGRKFKTVNDIRSELMVRPVGADGEQAHRYLMLERAVSQNGKKRRVFYEKVAEISFTRGIKKAGEYTGHFVESRRTTDYLGEPLTAEEDAWLTACLNTFKERYEHYLTHLDSHAVRSYVREYIYDLSGTCVKESGGLYFIKQEHSDQVAKLSSWVKSIGSEFHSLPLLNLADQREMILEAFEDETIKEVERLLGEVSKILGDPDRTIEERTYDAYALRAAELSGKVMEYNQMLGARADRAQIEVTAYAQQMMSLGSRIRQSKTLKAKVVPA
jgi:hypothetical protein